MLHNDWTEGNQDMHVLDVGVSPCNTTLDVRCVADEVGVDIYLPIIMQNFP